MFTNKFLATGKEIIESIVVCNPSIGLNLMPQESDIEIENFAPRAIANIPGSIISSVKENCCDYRWYLDDFRHTPPEEFEHQCSGRLLWYLESVGGAEASRFNFLEKTRRRFDAIKAKIWGNSVAFQHADIGGFLALDLSEKAASPVVLLNPNRKAISNCAILGNSLEEFLDHWSRLAFLSPSEKSFAPFTENFTQPLNADCDFAKRWLEWLTSGVPPKSAGKGKR